MGFMPPGEATCCTPGMLVAVERLGKGCLTVLLLTHCLCFILLLTQHLNCEPFEVKDH